MSSEPNWNPEIEPVRRAAAQGQLLLKACRDCGAAHYFPRTICPFCFSANTDWKVSGGLGTVYSYSIQRRVDVPFVMAYVTLDEGPTMMTWIVDTAALEDVHIGQRVEVVFRADESGAPVPMFRPAT
jgi:uncharacterized OB-fold protein